MNFKDISSIFPIAWVFLDDNIQFYLSKLLPSRGTEFLVADFASGENDKLPVFLHRALVGLIDNGTYPAIPTRDQWLRQFVTYSIDMHGLRLDSLLGHLEEQGIHDAARVVHAKLEDMDAKAAFRQSQLDLLETTGAKHTWLDIFLMKELKLPSECFDLAFLNNDVVGYLHEYYSTYTNPEMAFRKLREVMKTESLLVVTQPCSLYDIDNIAVLERCGFSFISGTDVEVSSSSSATIDRNTNLEALSSIGHFTFLVFKAHAVPEVD